MLKLCLAVIVCGGFILAACASGADNVITEIAPTVEEAIPPEVALEIQNRISELLGVPVESLQIENLDKMDWPNGCLGLPESGEVCTEAITPGWLVVFNVDGQEYTFRVDQTGTVIRQEP
jgi:hypothetical protein